MQQQMMAAAAAEQQAAMAQMAMMQHQQMLAHQHAMAAATAAANAKTAPAADPATPKLLADLREALLPSQRELAAEGLRSVDWKTNPEVVTELTKAAKEDPSPMVRVACIKALGAMRASSEPVLQTLEALSTDSDSRIREEANEAKSMLQQKR
jgi:HEAT repeat protein